MTEPSRAELVAKLGRLGEFYRHRYVSRDQVPSLEEISPRERDVLVAALDEAARQLSAISALTEPPEPAFTCKARIGAGANDPQDCDWPICGCDPAADKVIAALEEMGALTEPPPAIEALAKIRDGKVVHVQGEATEMQDWTPGEASEIAATALLALGGDHG